MAPEAREAYTSILERKDSPKNPFQGRQMIEIKEHNQGPRVLVEQVVELTKESKSTHPNPDRPISFSGDDDFFRHQEGIPVRYYSVSPKKKVLEEV
jgi:hypothetical protein